MANRDYQSVIRAFDDVAESMDVKSLAYLSAVGSVGMGLGLSLANPITDRLFNESGNGTSPASAAVAGVVMIAAGYGAATFTDAGTTVGNAVGGMGFGSALFGGMLVLSAALVAARGGDDASPTAVLSSPADNLPTSLSDVTSTSRSTSRKRSRPSRASESRRRSRSTGRTAGANSPSSRRRELETWG